MFLFCWAAFLSISLLASVFPVSLPLFFLFFRPCLIHARLPEGGRALVHGHTFLHSWSGPMTVVIGLLHGATFLSDLPLVLFVSFIGPWQLERTPIKPHLQLQFCNNLVFAHTCAVLDYLHVFLCNNFKGTSRYVVRSILSMRHLLLLGHLYSVASMSF